MKNHNIRIPAIILGISLPCFVISLIIAISEASPAAAIIMVLTFGASVCSAVTLICNLIAKRKGKSGKPFLSFLLTDIVLILAAVGYAVYNLLTETGMMAGLAGTLILIYVVPLLAGIGGLSSVIYLIVRHTNKHKVQKQQDFPTK